MDVNINNFDKILELVFSKSSLQKKKLTKYLETKDEAFFKSAEEFATDYISFISNQNISLESAVDAYIKMCNDMLVSQLYFNKTGKYPAENAENAFKDVYNNEVEMKSYMVGLAISQFLWSTHYKMYQFFLENIGNQSDKISSYLEIGPGHGLFLKDAYKIVVEKGNNVRFKAIDISQTSLDLSQSIVNLLIGKNNIDFAVMDALKYNEEESFDFITMGEVLEHVDFPDKLLSKINRLLTDNGVAFISTCINCPSIDHVYHFRCANEIHDILSKNDLIVKSELFLPVEDLPMDVIIKKKITINYCAIVSKKGF
ncbi:class I SAM-dependent methyltransferase [Bacteroidota bacterium]